MSILLKNLKGLNINNNEAVPKGFVYDNSEGYWKQESTDIPFVKHGAYAAPDTFKKFDIETGEDYKGK